MWGWWRSSRAKARDAWPSDPFAPPAWPPLPVDAKLVESGTYAPAPDPYVPSPNPSADATAIPPATATPAQPAPEPEPEPLPAAAAPAINAEANAQLLRLFEVVTNMCDHVIEYIESDRAERRMMLDTLTTLGRTITEGAAALTERAAGDPVPVEAVVVEPPASRERVIGGSMPSGPEPFIDLRSTAAPAADVVPSAASPPKTVMTKEIAVEVRGRFGDRWVAGFEICEAIETPEGHRYRLRRRRDGVILPELFDATSIRHVETFDQLTTGGASGNGSNGAHDTAPVNGASSWSRS